MATQPVRPFSLSPLARDVREGLTRPRQKKLFPKYFYDEVGSALFEAICLLPEYGLTRADERILQRHSQDIVARLGPSVMVAELGSGSGKKTRLILEALGRRQMTSYFPIEISAAALEMCERELRDIRGVSIVSCQCEYLDGLKQVAARRGGDDQLLVLFLGSTIGNLERPKDREFLRQVRKALKPGDALLLGTDMIKASYDLLRAYDDSLGVTAAFNLNLLVRLNRELDANFVLANFRHLARFNQSTTSVEMHLQSLKNQTVEIPQARITVQFTEGETIWTESSHKFNLDEIDELSRAAGFQCKAQWIDRQWLFAESLLIAG